MPPPHRAAHPPLGKGLELDPARFVEPMRGVNQSKDAVLDQIADVDGIRHGRSHATGQSLHKRKAGDDSAVLTGCDGLSIVVSLKGFRVRSFATRVPTPESVSNGTALGSP